ncbi:MAG: hypothetical protein A2Z99_02895 [Treponema sp. GWB1_62_6]|nr:MAG: hypothetical protein A2001_08840 [Treponema sp. GWC1_61_84]OHE70773.1 MAG: hypothetical protein A2413_10825 [Treponema sp. RIFOXYC1_FULL_61_9]OHE71337.1 MAG: hypothetical protein A2Z99_02895 [Treponema sp. GWB1_62_6]HCM25007.1 lipoate--protein ligase [Treponema sp.]
MRVVRSLSLDIHLNLAIENNLFLDSPEGERCLFLWRNSRSVVIGRYQNPWLECALGALRDDGVVLARRQSGGGAVWHDEGNLCFTFMGPRAGFSRDDNIALVAAALRDLGADASVNDRRDIMVGGRKVSGSAYREAAGRAFHHGTLLVEADLHALSRYLKSSVPLLSSRGVKSVRSPVANIRDTAPDADAAAIRAAIARRWAPGAAVESVGEEEAMENAGIAAFRARSASRDWVLGSSPPFVRLLEFEIEADAGKRETIALEAHVEGGRIAQAKPARDGVGSAPGRVTAEAAEALRGADYENTAMAAAAGGRAKQALERGDEPLARALESLARAAASIDL